MLFEVIDVDIPSTTCPRDALLIYSGAVAVGEAEKRLCGHLEDWEWISRDNDALLQLISDSSDTYQGFSLDFRSFLGSIKNSTILRPLHHFNNTYTCKTITFLC